MAATTTDRNTLRCDGLLPVPVYQATKIPGGVLVQDNGSGYAINAVESATYLVLGVSAEQADNSSGSSGDLDVQVEFQRAFWLANDTGSPVLISHRGGFCYVKNNQTVRASGGSYDNPAGIVLDVDATKGVLVYVPQALLAAATVVTDLAVGRDLAVTRNSTFGGTTKTTGVATFDAKSVHSLGITITAGGETITKGDLTLSEGSLTLTKGDATLTKGNLTLTDGDLTMTQGLIKMVGVTANDGVQIGYVSAAITEPPKITELDTDFGTKAAGRNGFIGVIRNSGGTGKVYLSAIANGAWYSTELTAAS